jgi:hypothetical protein
MISRQAPPEQRHRRRECFGNSLLPLPSSIKWMNWRERQKRLKGSLRNTRNGNKTSTTISVGYARASALLVILSLQLLRLDAVNICDLMCGLICRFNVVILYQWFAADVWNVNCYYLIVRLNSYVVSLCSSDDLKLLLWRIDCTPSGRSRTGHATWSNKNATCGRTNTWHVNWPGHDTWAIKNLTRGRKSSSHVDV